MDDFGNLSDDDLMAMAQKAGYLPGSPDAPTDSGGLPPPAEAPMRQGLTPPSLQLSSPAAGPMSPGSSYGMNQSYRGFSDPAFNRVSKHDDALTRDFKNADAEAAVGAQRDAAIAQSPRADLIDAEKAKAQAVVGQIHQTGENALVMQRLQDGFAAEEAKINAESSHLANQAKMDYLAALNDFRASRVDPSQLWGNMTGGQKIGMLATAFVHDFLGVKGVHTSAMDTFNKAIDRNIDSQIQALKTKGEVADGFKSLWEMQRSQSSSDTEARARVRGFLLEGAKQQVIANMTQYESALASAQGQAAIAKIDEEMSKTLIDIYRHSDANALQLRNQALEKWKTKVNASLESQSLGLKAQELQDKRNELKGQKGNPLAKYLADITPSGGGKIRYEITAGRPEKQDEVREQMGSIANFDNQVGQFQELMRKVGTVPIANLPGFMQSPEGARLIALRDAMARNLAYAKSGKQVNESETEHFKNQMPIETWLTNGSREKTIAQTNELLRNESFSAIAPFVREIGENEAIQGEDGNQYRLRDIVANPHFNAPGEIPTGVPGDAQALNNKNIITPPPMSQEERIRTEAGKYLRAADKADAVDEEELTEGIVPAREAFVKEHPEFAATGKSAGDQFAEKVGASEPSVAVSRYDKGLMMLARAAEGGDKQALQQLKQEANSYIKGGDKTDEGAVWAAWLLNEVSPGLGISDLEE